MRGVPGGWRDWFDDDDTAQLRAEAAHAERRLVERVRVTATRWQAEVQREQRRRERERRRNRRT